MTTSDGAVLAACLADAGAKDPVETLRRYEEVRRPRVTRLQEMSRANKTRFHLPDGPEQVARDAEWTKAGDRSPEALRWLYGFDAAAVTRAQPGGHDSGHRSKRR
ncbi:MAG: FAD-dependent oxidoreductase [Gemmatimonadales bacterium]